MMRRHLRTFLAALAVLAALPGFSQTVTVTPTLVSAQLGQPLYCAIKPYLTSQIQLYCFTSQGGTWNRLVWNQIIDPTVAVGIPSIVICPAGTTTVCSPSSASTTMIWQFNSDAQGIVHWAVSGSGSSMVRSGELQGGAFQ